MFTLGDPSYLPPQCLPAGSPWTQHRAFSISPGLLSGTSSAHRNHKVAAAHFSLRRIKYSIHFPVLQSWKWWGFHHHLIHLWWLWMYVHSHTHTHTLTCERRPGPAVPLHQFWDTVAGRQQNRRTKQCDFSDKDRFLGQRRQAEEQVCWPWAEQSCCPRSLCSQSPWRPSLIKRTGWAGVQEQAHVHSPMTSRQDAMCCNSKAGASSTYTGRKTFFRNREEEAKDEGEESQILERRWGNVRGPMSSQSAVQGRTLHVCHHHRNRLCWRSCLRPGCPGLAPSRTLEKVSRHFPWKVDAILCKGQLLLSGTTVIFYRGNLDFYATLINGFLQ